MNNQTDKKTGARAALRRWVFPLGLLGILAIYFLSRLNISQENSWQEFKTNMLLAEMDGFDPSTGRRVMAATNRADIMDPALLRAGRFDRHVYLELPNKQEREAIIQVHLKPLLLDGANHGNCSQPFKAHLEFWLTLNKKWFFNISIDNKIKDKV